MRSYLPCKGIDLHNAIAVKKLFRKFFDTLRSTVQKQQVIKKHFHDTVNVIVIINYFRS